MVISQQLSKLTLRNKKMSKKETEIALAAVIGVAGVIGGQVAENPAAVLANGAASSAVIRVIKNDKGDK